MPFDEQSAERAVRFIETYLTHTKGQFAGQPFLLRDWQRTHIKEIFGRVNDDGYRQIRQVYWEIPKKNGKSEVAAAIALTLLYCDREVGAEIYGAAADRDQASIVFNVAAGMVRGDRKLSTRSKVIDSSKRIVVPQMGSFYRALSADVAGKHGFNVHNALFSQRRQCSIRVRGPSGKTDS